MTKTELTAALVAAAEMLDVARVVTRRSGNYEGANVLDAASKAAWDAVAQERESREFEAYASRSYVAPDLR